MICKLFIYSYIYTFHQGQGEVKSITYNSVTFTPIKYVSGWARRPLTNETHAVQDKSPNRTTGTRSKAPGRNHTNHDLRMEGQVGQGTGRSQMSEVKKSRVTVSFFSNNKTQWGLNTLLVFLY